MPRLLLVNPWIFDFAAYDFWLKPIGLLALASALKDADFKIDFLDLTDAALISDGQIKSRLKRMPDGRGNFFSQEIEKPPQLKSIPRRYKRYGMPPESAEKLLSNMPEPDAILLGTTMTYWSRGYIDTVRFLRGIFGDTPVIAGGLYVNICPEHAQENLDADFYCLGDYEKVLPGILQKALGIEPFFKSPEELKLALDLYSHLDYGVILTGRGCPFRCSYCVSWRFHPQLKRKPLELAVDEIKWQAKELGLKNIAFYDDALIMDAEHHLIPILEALVKDGLPLNFHAPNGIHIKPMSKELAGLMRRSGFETIRFGLETADPNLQKKLGCKAELDDLDRALSHLESAGYRRSGIGVYLLAGLPGQSAEQIERDIREVKKLGARPYLSEYSPIPGTDLWAESLAASRYPIDQDPLFQNCTLLPCCHPSLTPQRFSQLKALCRE